MNQPSHNHVTLPAVSSEYPAQSSAQSYLVTDARLRYDSARSFDVDEDLEFNPALTPEELNAAYAESSMSTRSGRSDTSSPPQAQSQPMQLNPYAQHHQHHLQQQQQQHHYNSQQQHPGNHTPNHGRSNRKARNAIPIVHPTNYNAGQGAWR